MKKQLLTLCAVAGVCALVAQPAPNFSTNQHAIYPSGAVQNPGVRFLDAVDANVVWTIGFSGNNAALNYNWYSKTVNGGSSFAGGNVYADTNTYRMANMEGIDANTAWVSAFMKATQSKGAIHRTTNGGTSWFNMTPSNAYTNTAAFTNIVSFFTPSIGITMGDPVNGEFEIWRTTDGGNSWSAIPGSSIPNPLSGNEFGIVNLYYKHGSNNLWFGTNEGRMYRTTDAGLTWSVGVVAPTCTLLEIGFSSPLNGITSVFSSSQTIELFNTTDGGQTWNFIGQPTNLGYADFAGIPGTGLLVSVDNDQTNMIVSISSDNGATWVDQGSANIQYNCVDFANSTSGWLGAYDFTTSSQFNVWKYSGSGFSGTVTPTASFSMQTVLCLTGNSATLIPGNSSIGSPQNSYSWTASSGALVSSATASAPTITFPSAGVYTITLSANNGVGINVSQQQVTVTACTAPAATFTAPTNVCTNYSFTASNASSGAPAPTYSWSVLPSSQVTITPSPFAASPQIRLGNAVNYTITLYVTNAAGTSSMSQVVTPAVCAPAANFTIPASFLYCAPPSVAQNFSTTNQTTNPPGGAVSYTWSLAPGIGFTVAPNYFTPNIIITPQTNVQNQYTVTLRARNASGTSTVTQVITIDNCLFVGMDQNVFETQVSFYPNPATDFVDVTLGDNTAGYDVKVTNILGSVIHQEFTNESKVRVNMANRPSGVYFVTVQSGEQKVTRKIIVE